MRTGRARRVATALVIATCVAGCAGNGEGLDGNGRPLGSGDPGGEPLTADFDSIQAHVFTPVCTTCHAGGAAPQGLRLDAGNSYDLLVGVPSNEQPSVLRVNPGNPDASYLVHKLEGSAAVGGRMPLGGPYLDAATLAVIRQWITDGALRSPASATPATFALATATPANGAMVTEAPAQLVVAFTHELDRTRLDASAVRLERVAATGDTPLPAIVPTDFVVPEANPTALLVRPRMRLAPGQYALHLDAAAIVDLAGRRPAVAGASAPALVVRFEVMGVTP